MRDPILIEVLESSAVGEVRRTAVSRAAAVGLSGDDVDRVSLTVTEIATNLVKHAGGGLILIGAADNRSGVLEVLALDSGPGIKDIPLALRDGHSTTGTSGTGLGAVVRHAEFFQVYSRATKGTAILARFAAKGGKAMDAAVVGAVTVPIRGEEVNGDGWASKSLNGTTDVMVVDGLGHGQAAHDAAAAASDAFMKTTTGPALAVTAVHDALRGTRGAAIAIARLNRAGASLLFCGVGNISATIVDAAARRSAVSLYGIVGHQMREAREFTYPWSRDSTLIMHSDGLTTRWDLDSYPALLRRDAVLIAGVLWKDHRRPNDDSTVVVVQGTS